MPITVYTKRGIGPLSLLTIVLIVLKLLNLISISWWWVFSPVLFGVGIVLLSIFFFFIIVLLVSLLGI